MRLLVAQLQGRAVGQSPTVWFVEPPPQASPREPQQGEAGAPFCAAVNLVSPNSSYKPLGFGGAGGGEKGHDPGCRSRLSEDARSLERLAAATFLSGFLAHKVSKCHWGAGKGHIPFSRIGSRDRLRKAQPKPWQLKVCKCRRNAWPPCVLMKGSIAAYSGPRTSGSPLSFDCMGHSLGSISCKCSASQSSVLMTSLGLTVDTSSWAQAPCTEPGSPGSRALGARA